MNRIFNNGLYDYDTMSPTLTIRYNVIFFVCNKKRIDDCVCKSSSQDTVCLYCINNSNVDRFGFIYVVQVHNMVAIVQFCLYCT